MKELFKRVNIISKEVEEDGSIVQQSGIVMRVTKSLALTLIQKGSWNYTTKSKLRSFLNKDAKLSRNKRAIETFGTIGGQHRDKYSGKEYVYLATMRLIHTFTKWHIRKLTKLSKFANVDIQHYGEPKQIKHPDTGNWIRETTPEETGRMRIITKFPEKKYSYSKDN